MVLVMAPFILAHSMECLHLSALCKSIYTFISVAHLKRVCDFSGFTCLLNSNQMPGSMKDPVWNRKKREYFSFFSCITHLGTENCPGLLQLLFYSFPVQLHDAGPLIHSHLNRPNPPHDQVICCNLRTGLWSHLLHVGTVPGTERWGMMSFLPCWLALTAASC